jgi:hypothetical protein
MKQRAWMVVWFTTLIVGAVAFGLPQNADSQSTQPEIYAGVFRKQPGNVWLYTRGHASINVDWGRCLKVSKNRPAALVIKITNPGRQVGVPILNPDETQAQHGITMGASVTVDKVRVFFFKNGRPISCWHPFFDTNRNNTWALGVVIH